MKSLWSTESVIRPGKDVISVNIDNRAGYNRNELDGRETGNNKVNDKIDNEVGKKDLKTSKSKNLFKKSAKKTVGSDFLTPGAKLAFTKLRQVFLKAPILYHFDSECYIQIRIDVSGYIIGEFFNQLTLDDLGQWHSMVFFS